MAFAQQNNRIVKISPGKGVGHHHYYQHQAAKGKIEEDINILYLCHDIIRFVLSVQATYTFYNRISIRPCISLRTLIQFNGFICFMRSYFKDGVTVISICDAYQSAWINTSNEPLFSLN